MNGFIKLFKTKSRKTGKPMLSSAYSYDTPIGRAFQGTNQASEVEDVMWFNPATKVLCTEQEYYNLGQSEPTGDSVDESSQEIAAS